jgi:hypothetical protein
VNGPIEVDEIADRLGFNKVGARQVQCPRSNCNGDGKASVVVFSNGVNWRCVRCSARGDSLDYAAFAVLGEVPPQKSKRWLDVYKRIDTRPGAAAGKPVGGTQGPTPEEEAHVLPHPDSVWEGSLSRGQRGKRVYFAAPNTPFIPLLFRRRRAGRGKS